MSGHSAIDGCTIHVLRLLFAREEGKDRWEAETLAQMVVHGIANVKGERRRKTPTSGFARCMAFASIAEVMGIGLR